MWRRRHQGLCCRIVSHCSITDFNHFKRSPLNASFKRISSSTRTWNAFNKRNHRTKRNEWKAVVKPWNQLWIHNTECVQFIFQKCFFLVVILEWTVWWTVPGLLNKAFHGQLKTKRNGVSKRVRSVLERHFAVSWRNTAEHGLELLLS